MKTLLVSLNNVNAIDRTLAVASALAQKHDAHIIGLYVIPSIIVYAAPYGHGVGAQYIDRNNYYKTHAAEAEKAFNAIVRKDSLKGEWRQINPGGQSISHTIVAHGRESDMIVISSQSRNTLQEGSDFDLCARVVQEAGRPLLILPAAGKKALKHKKAVIGWDGSREAARAVFDALPLLKAFDRVHITCINPKREMQIADELPGTELAAALDRHGINAITETIKTRKRISAALLERAEKADLLVIGAYGHSRLRESILGGVTAKTLKAMTCPVLMSN